MNNLIGLWFPFAALAGIAGVGTFLVAQARLAAVARGYLLFGLWLVVAAGTVYVVGGVYSPENLRLRFWAHEVLLMMGGVALLRGLCGVGFVAVQNKRLDATSVQIARLQEELRTKSGVLSSVLRSSQGAMLILEPQRTSRTDIVGFRATLANRAAEHLLGVPESAIVGASVNEFAPCLEDSGLLEAAANVCQTGMPYTGQYCFRPPGGEQWFEIVIVPHCNGLAVNALEITDRKRVEGELVRAAQMDALTGLGNRAALVRRLRKAIGSARSRDGYCIALLLLDFDHFKVINDSLGHHVGDELLISIAERLRANLRAIDLPASDGSDHLPARLGGDEFVVLLEGLADPNHAMIIADRLHLDLGEPHRIAGHKIHTSASIGVVTSSGQYASADDMLRDADTAMYEAKRNGKGRSCEFDSTMHERVQRRLILETDLRAAVRKGALLLEFQPIVSLQTAKVAGFEGLIRWPHPTMGLLPPDQFVPVAEETYLIVPMGRWVLEQCCDMLARMQREFPGQELFVHLNHSKLEIVQPGFTDFVADVVKSSRVNPRQIRLEITETACLDSDTEVLGILRELQNIGVGVALDDFGTGEATLSLLHRFTFDCVKIDRNFVSGEKSVRQNAAFLKSIIGLCHNLAIPVVAEGVETRENLALLQAFDCQFGQGWLFGKSEPADVALRRLNASFELGAAA